jgi:hypothetical protein
VSAVRIALGALLLIGCEGGKHAEHAIEHAQEEATQMQSECVDVFKKVSSCRDDLLLLARAGAVMRGDTPELGLTASNRLADAMSSDLEAQCAKGVPADLAKGVECIQDDCRKMASCILAGLEYPPLAEGPDALRCRDGLPALEAKGQGKVLQWCVMPDGTPHGLYRVTDAAGTVLVEGAYDRGALTGSAKSERRVKWWE